MNITQEQKENSTLVFTAVFSDEEKKQFEAQALKKICTTIQIDGFRKGHVPESIVRQKVGEQGVQSEVLEIAIQKGYKKALSELKKNPVAQPEVGVQKLDPIEITISVQLYPEVSVQDFASDIVLESIEVKEEEIASQIEMFRNKLAENTDVDREAKEGDIAVIDFDGKDKEGITQPGMQSEGHPLELGSKTFIPGFEEEVIGMKAGEEKTFPILFPEDYNAKEYAGKEYFFTVKVQTVQEKKLPEVNDAFAQQLTGDNERTVEGLKEEIKTTMLDQKKSQEYQKKQKELFDTIGENTTAEIPPVFLEEELTGMIDNAKLQGLYSGTPWEKHLENMGKTEEELREEMIPDAKKTILSRLGLQSLIEQEKISASDEEIAEEIEKEMAKLKDSEKKEKQHSFEKEAEEWIKIENRLHIRKYFESHLKTA